MLTNTGVNTVHFPPKRDAWPLVLSAPLISQRSNCYTWVERSFRYNMSASLSFLSFLFTKPFAIWHDLLLSCCEDNPLLFWLRQIKVMAPWLGKSISGFHYRVRFGVWSLWFPLRLSVLSLHFSIFYLKVVSFSFPLFIQPCCLGVIWLTWGIAVLICFCSCMCGNETEYFDWRSVQNLPILPGLVCPLFWSVTEFISKCLGPIQFKHASSKLPFHLKKLFDDTYFVQHGETEKKGAFWCCILWLISACALLDNAHDMRGMLSYVIAGAFKDSRLQYWFV